MKRFLSLTLSLIVAGSAYAAPHYQVIDLGPTNKSGHTPPSAIWRLTDNDETVVGNIYRGGEDDALYVLPSNAQNPQGPTENGDVYVQIGQEYKWWNPRNSVLIPAPAGITSMSSNGWTARAEIFGSHPRVVEFPPLQTNLFQVFQDSGCDSANDSCVVSTNGINDIGDVASTTTTINEDGTVTKIRYNSLERGYCDIGPLARDGAFVYATCTGNTKTWNLYAGLFGGGPIPSPQDGNPVWTSMNSAQEIVGYVDTLGSSRPLLIFNGALFDLNGSINADSPYRIDAAYAVNDRGSILAVGTNKNNPTDHRALLLTETPFFVNSALDGSDINPGDGICDASAADGEQCTLRAAITEANASPGRSEIRFNIPATGEPVINIKNELPILGQATRILGVTQPGGRVAINGSQAGPISSAFIAAASDNEFSGLRVYGFGLNGINLVTGGRSKIRNSIFGIAPDGTSAKFGGYAIFITESSDNVIGGSTAEGNIIANAGIAGVSIEGVSVRNRISSNIFFGNSTLGIDLGDNGASPNHGAGFMTGPNNFQNSPEITGYAITGGVSSVTGGLTAEPLKSFTIQLFASECSGSRGQGRQLLGEASAKTSTSGHADFQFIFPISIGAVTATATDQDGNTSEFSPIKVSPESIDGSCTTAPLTLSTKTSYYQKGKGKLSFKCPGEGSCQGTLTLKYRKNKKMLDPRVVNVLTIAKAAFKSTPTGNVSAAYVLNKQGQQLLASNRGKLPATAVLSITMKNGVRGASAFAVTIKRK